MVKIYQHFTSNFISKSPVRRNLGQIIEKSIKIHKRNPIAECQIADGCGKSGKKWEKVGKSGKMEKKEERRRKRRVSFLVW